MIDIQTQFTINLFLVLAILVLLLGTIFLSWVLYDKIREWKRKRKTE